MKILITGISGQDGIYLSKLISKKYKNFNIIGVSRNLNSNNFVKISKIKLDLPNQNLKILNLNLLDYNQLNIFIKDFKPNMVFNFSGPSSVYKSIKNPEEKVKITSIFENLTNTLIKNRNFCNFFQASTSEMFGLNNKEIIYTEKSKFLPNSPYAEGKLINHKSVLDLKNKFDWNIYSGIMFNHESEFRSDNYLIMQIINSAMKISKGELKKLKIGSTEYVRDWSYAKEIVKGVFEITTNGRDADYVLGSGIGNSIGYVLNVAFNFFNLDYKNYIEIDKSILRKNDPKEIIADPSKIYNELGWKTETSLEKIIENICIYKINNPL